MFKYLVDFFTYFFGYCLYCHENLNALYSLCEICLNKMEKYKGCFICGLNCNCEFKTIIPFKYNFISRNLILSFKYSHNFAVGNFFISFIKNHITSANPVFVPIPLTRKKLFQRTYNQSVILCKQLISHIKDLPHIKSTNIAYFALDRKKISTNIELKFGTEKERFIKASQIILNDISSIVKQDIYIVDDVIASGETMLRVIDLCKPYAKTITIISLCKT